MQGAHDSNLQDAEFRRAVGLRALYLLHEAIEKNGGVYSGLLVPNVTSVAHILADATITELRAMVEQWPRLNPATDPF